MLCPTHQIPAVPGIFDGIIKEHCPKCGWVGDRTSIKATAPAPAPRHEDALDRLNAALAAEEPQRGSVIPAQGCAPRALRATLGSRPECAPNPEGVASFHPFIPVVQKVENEYGWMGPDFCLIHLRNGNVIEIGDEGIGVWVNFAHYVAGKNPEHSITFLPASAPLRAPSASSALKVP